MLDVLGILVQYREEMFYARRMARSLTIFHFSHPSLGSTLIELTGILSRCEKGKYDSGYWHNRKFASALHPNHWWIISKKPNCGCVR